MHQNLKPSSFDANDNNLLLVVVRRSLVISSSIAALTSLNASGGPIGPGLGHSARRSRAEHVGVARKVFPGLGYMGYQVGRCDQTQQTNLTAASISGFNLPLQDSPKKRERLDAQLGSSLESLKKAKWKVRVAVLPSLNTRHSRAGQSATGDRRSRHFTQRR
jgi:hypothetical protein